MARFLTKLPKLVVIQFYAPTEQKKKTHSAKYLRTRFAM